MLDKGGFVVLVLGIVTIGIVVFLTEGKKIEDFEVKTTR